MASSKALFVLISFVCCLSVVWAAVSLAVKDFAVTIQNDFVKIHFRNDCQVDGVYSDGTNLHAHGQHSFYFDYSNHGQNSITPSSIHIVEQTDERVHFYWLQEKKLDHFRMEYHYIMEDGVRGVYTYVKFFNDQDHNLGFAHTRIIYRFNSSIMSYGNNQLVSAKIPDKNDLADCHSVQDATCQYPNGTYYTKYDYGVYIRRTNYHGLYGNGFGVFLISPSREYHAGGPLKQDLTFHQISLLSECFHSGRFGVNTVNAPPGWSQLYGPFMLYFPVGDNDEIFAAVKNQVVVEQNRWPYEFVNEPEYALVRGQVSGTVSGQKNATVVLWDSLEENFDEQSLGYLYTADTDANGNYNITKVRPGNYRMAAYPIAGYGSDSLAEQNVTITANGSIQVNFTLDEPQNIIWALGEANRLSSEFKFSDQQPNFKWEWLCPQILNFTIGKDDPKEEWYYAQTKRDSHWYITYNDTRDGKSRNLRVALAAASQKNHLIIDVNGHRLANMYYSDDHSIYRSAMNSGHYHQNVFKISASWVVNGTNTIALWLHRGQVMYDTISLQRNDA